MRKKRDYKEIAGDDFIPYMTSFFIGKGQGS
jgi:hypothetical protein